MFSQDKEEADGEEKEELMGNGTSSSADRRRHIWRLSSRATDEREVGGAVGGRRTTPSLQASPRLASGPPQRPAQFNSDGFRVVVKAQKKK